jgi:hypothetical protein
LHSGGVESDGKGVEKEPWLTRRVLGPVPGYGVLVGGIGLAAGLGLLVKKIFFK